MRASGLPTCVRTKSQYLQRVGGAPGKICGEVEVGSAPEPTGCVRTEPQCVRKVWRGACERCLQHRLLRRHLAHALPHGRRRQTRGSPHRHGCVSTRKNTTPTFAARCPRPLPGSHQATQGNVRRAFQPAAPSLLQRVVHAFRQAALHSRRNGQLHVEQRLQRLGHDFDGLHHRPARHA